MRALNRATTAAAILAITAVAACSSVAPSAPESPAALSSTTPATIRVEYPVLGAPVEVHIEDPNLLTLECSMKSAVVRVKNRLAPVGYTPGYQLRPAAGCWPARLRQHRWRVVPDFRPDRSATSYERPNSVQSIDPSLSLIKDQVLLHTA